MIKGKRNFFYLPSGKDLKVTDPGMELADIPDILLLRSLTTPLSSFHVFRGFDDKHSAADESSSRLVLLLLLVLFCNWKCSSILLLSVIGSTAAVVDDASASSNSSCWAALFQTILSFCRTNFSIIMFLMLSSGGLILCHSSTMIIDARHLVAGGIILHRKKYQKYFCHSLTVSSSSFSLFFNSTLWYQVRRPLNSPQIVEQ